MTWLDDFILYRSANLSNVFLIETDDPKRLQQFINFIKSRERLRKYLYHLQTSEIEDLTVYQTSRGSLMNVLETLRKLASVVIIAWVTTPAEARQLMPFIVTVAQDPNVYCPASERNAVKPVPSTAVVFIHSLEFIPENIRKMCVEITPPVSTYEERLEFLEKTAETVRKLLNIDVRVTPAVVDATAGLNLHEVESACLLSIRKTKGFDLAVFRDFKASLLKRYGLEVIYPRRGFESVGGYKYLKDWFRTRVVDAFKHPDVVRKYGESLPRGVLLYGYPGTGKTWFCKALAKELGLPMVKLSAADFLRGIVGETEARVRRVVKLLESLAPAVVFIDEIDQLFISRASLISTDSGVSRRLQNMLLDWLGDENRKTFVVGATNYVEQMDFAAIRVGRFDKIVFVSLPDYEARKEILRVHFEVVRKPEVPVRVDYDEVARATWLWTGAEIENLVRETITEARIRRAPAITTELVLSVKERLMVRVDKRIDEIKKMLEIAETLANVDAVSLNEARKVLKENTSEVRDVRFSGL